ncbi:MAG: hypothetical protein ACD_39C00854G0001 [uncultured bacterium]|nr:MAG: hypothetical protein ACD_39C00854G0001 [uncultured bacterium]
MQYNNTLLSTTKEEMNSDSREYIDSSKKRAVHVLIDNTIAELSKTKIAATKTSEF